MFFITHYYILVAMQFVFDKYLSDFELKFIGEKVMEFF